MAPVQSSLAASLMQDPSLMGNNSLDRRQELNQLNLDSNSQDSVKSNVLIQEKSSLIKGPYKNALVNNSLMNNPNYNKNKMLIPVPERDENAIAASNRNLGQEQIPKLPIQNAANQEAPAMNFNPE